MLKRVMLTAELYANYSAQDDGEIYANDIATPTATNGAPPTVDSVKRGEGEMEEEYQNVIEINRTSGQPQQQQQQQQPTSNEDNNDDDHIYQNVRRKPTPAPKPTRRF